ncbi:MAG: DUF2164 domain-containing protein [Candidatus Marinimicrobia bacterium]|nr:DUF2164 domain-containing protein [Candidatus Neomarinimicrobiota bacterium]
MNHIFSRELKNELVQKIQLYFQNELDQELGAFEAEFLLDFFSEYLGPHYYNQAVRDVQKHLSGYLDNLNDRIDELEKPIPEALSGRSE